jgi:mannose-1-phosphate guanylyltransferase
MSPTHSLFLVVMAGGSGTRFWPKSTSARPKQLLSFGDSNQTLIQQTLHRFDGMVSGDPTHRLIVTTQKLKSAIEEQVPPDQAHSLAEPTGRNTAPCIYWAAREVYKKNPKGLMMVMPSDHYIPDLRAFQKTLLSAIDWAKNNDDLVTLGVKPTRPETGYGYLKMGKALGDSQGEGCRKVEAFVEKPNLDRAQEFLKTGNYLWNGGMFLWRVDVILAAFDQFMPEMKAAWEKSSGHVESAYPMMPATSIDYGVMEKAKNVVSFELNCGWDDLGAWTSLESISGVMDLKKDFGVLSAGEVISVDSKNNIIDAPGKLVTLLGIEDLIIVHQGDSILVAKKDRAQDLKLLVDQVKLKRPDQA